MTPNFAMNILTAEGCTVESLITFFYLKLKWILQPETVSSHDNN